jgi:hypothetical protein
MARKGRASLPATGVRYRATWKRDGDAPVTLRLGTAPRALPPLTIPIACFNSTAIVSTLFTRVRSYVLALGTFVIVLCACRAGQRLYAVQLSLIHFHPDADPLAKVDKVSRIDGSDAAAAMNAPLMRRWDESWTTAVSPYDTPKRLAYRNDERENKSQRKDELRSSIDPCRLRLSASARKPARIDRFKKCDPQG